MYIALGLSSPALLYSMQRGLFVSCDLKQLPQCIFDQLKMPIHIQPSFITVTHLDGIHHSASSTVKYMYWHLAHAFLRLR